MNRKQRRERGLQRPLQGAKLDVLLENLFAEHFALRAIVLAAVDLSLDDFEKTILPPWQEYARTLMATWRSLSLSNLAHLPAAPPLPPAAGAPDPPAQA